jgi:hypothetical protein
MAVGAQGKDGGGMKVYLAYYHAGFQSSPPRVIAVCSTRQKAQELLEGIMASDDRDRDLEHEDHASWWVQERTVEE